MTTPTPLASLASERGVTVSDVAVQCGVHYETARAWWHGRSALSERHVHALEKLLGADATLKVFASQGKTRNVALPMSSESVARLRMIARRDFRDNVAAALDAAVICYERRHCEETRDEIRDQQQGG
jgi:transposase-like protein